MSTEQLAIGDRRDFVLPDFTRLSWASDLARQVWEPRVAQIIRAWHEIEWRAVAEGVRPCSVTIVSPEQFVEEAPIWAEHGLNALPVEMLAASSHTYSSTGAPVEAGKPFAFRLVIGRPSDVAAFKRAWQAGNQDEIGRLLGYPACCREFFQAVWVDAGMVDTTWSMAVNTSERPAGERTVEASGPAQANILWRWMGPRSVSHLPCSFDCPATVALADLLAQVGRDAGFGQEMDWLDEILSWPVEWSALHGIAEIKTPILKVSTRTDATGRKYTVRWLGTQYPAEGAQGTVFPYRQMAGTPWTATRAYQAGLNHPLPLVAGIPSWYAADNGFTSRRAMDEAHEPIVKLAVGTLGAEGGNVLDLGCGNGALVKKIAKACPEATPFGVEAMADRVAHARELDPEHADNFVQGDLVEDEAVWADDRHYALAILMPGRLLGAAPDQAERLRARLRDRCDHIVVYAYGDWLDRFGGLANLAREAGLELIERIDECPTAALATVCL